MFDTGHDYDRAKFLKNTGFGLAAAAFAADSLGTTQEAAAAGASSAPPPAASNPADALAVLKAGNARFVAGTPQCGPLTARIAELAHGQSPFAIVLGCSDSRVPIETVFDQVPGNVFVVRVAGNFLNDDGLGSIEYAIAVLKSKLVVVLGHSSCGAVGAAVEYVKNGTTQPGHIQDLVTAIAPAAQATKSSGGDWVADAIAENVKRTVHAVTSRSTIVSGAIAAGDVHVVGGVYDLRNGSVTFS